MELEQKDIFAFGEYLESLRMRDLLTFQRMVSIELSKRLTMMENEEWNTPPYPSTQHYSQKCVVKQR